MMTIRLIQLTVFAAICLVAFAQDSALDDMAKTVAATAPQAQKHAVPAESLGILAEMR